MNNYIVMLVEASVAMILFYSVYYLWLRKETFFQLNRLYLLWSVLISMLIPLINIPLSKGVDEIVVYNLIESISVAAKAYEYSFVSTLSTFEWIGTVYLLGVLLSSIYFFMKLFQIKRIRKHETAEFSGNLPDNIVFINKDVVPFSFLNRMYINPKLYTDEQLNKIVAHETVHINQLHTIDSMMYELLIILFWFNPIAYRYRKSAKELHEYLADEGVVRSGVSSISYQDLLFKQATGLDEMKLANSFNYSLIKRRLVMLTKIKSSKIAKVRLLWVLPVLLSVVLVFACNEQGAEVVYSQKNAEVGDVIVYDEVEEMPIYPGGDEELRIFIADNIKYPKEAVENGTHGRVFVSFVVNKAGEVQDVAIKRGVSIELDEEAKRVVSSMPNWTPGKQDGELAQVKYTIPINFALSNDNNEEYTWYTTVNESGTEIKEKVYFEVDEMPEFEGGSLAIRKFIAQNVKYPSLAKELGTAGKVYIQFIVNEEGQVVEVNHVATKVGEKTIKSIDGIHVVSYGEEKDTKAEAILELQKEAIRVVSLLPDWKPGSKDGNPVKVQFTVPINFVLE